MIAFCTFLFPYNDIIKMFLNKFSSMLTKFAKTILDLEESMLALLYIEIYSGQSCKITSTCSPV